MEKLILLLLAALSMSFGSEEERGVITISPVSLEKSEKVPNLTIKESIFRFQVKNITDDKKNRVIIYSINGVERKARLIDNEFFDVRTAPGKHKFQFYYDEHYSEIYSDSLLIKGQYRDVYSLYFENLDFPVMIDKPVIYLYPEVDAKVSVQVDVRGNNPFFYPEYNDTWEFTATTQGELKFGNASYNYLFWDAEQFYPLSAEESQNGYICEGENAVAFLEEKLTMAGLTSQEQADFITFWGPRLQHNELNYVHFMFNEECNAFAELTISPKPDHVYRIYMMWSPIESEFIVKEQTILPMDRNGFCVLEWGGQEQPMIQTLEIY
ncbi:MAG: hypothetical protein QNK23_05875 [Crocinitomicaceae bacterium]|nr:hypothetical protein [Crocinitomicaceae bacterium]